MICRQGIVVTDVLDATAGATAAGAAATAAAATAAVVAVAARSCRVAMALTIMAMFTAPPSAEAMARRPMLRRRPRRQTAPPTRLRTSAARPRMRSGLRRPRRPLLTELALPPLAAPKPLRPRCHDLAASQSSIMTLASAGRFEKSSRKHESHARGDCSPPAGRSRSSARRRRSFSRLGAPPEVNRTDPGSNPGTS